MEIPIVSHYRRWRHAGEDGAIAVYAATCWAAPVIVVCAIIGSCLAILHRPYLAGLAAIFAFATVPDLDNFRRAILFTPTSVRYRPTFGILREIPFNDIFVVKRTEISRGFRGPLNVPAVELSLVFGERLFMGLDLDKGEEALERLCKATNQTR